MNVKALKARMVLSGDEDFAKAISEVLRISRQTAGAKLSGNSEFTQSEAAAIARYYHLSNEEIRLIFF